MNHLEKTTLAVSVRALIEHSLRTGDLEMTFFGTARPLEGGRIHRLLQKSRPEGYEAEVIVSRTVETDTLVLRIGGRIDGVLITADGTVIEEIKTTTRSLDDVVAAENPLHWGQAQCYAFMYAAGHGLSSLIIRLTYYNLDTGEALSTDRRYTLADLEAFFSTLTENYLSWAVRLAEWKNLRNESIANLIFPYDDYRPGQRRMAEGIYRTIRDGGQLIVQAPTGIGKTVAALFPAIKAIYGGHTDIIFYLTARTTGKTVAEKALDDLRGAGLRLKSLTLTAKERICFMPESACNGEECPYARGFFDRVGAAIGEVFDHDAMTRETVEDIARKHEVCPFEFSLEAALNADCIICDYNYAFDPRICLRRFFEEGNGEITLLVDEAHNLVDRARDMFSAELMKEPVLGLRRSVKNDLAAVHRALGGINTELVALRKRCEAAKAPLVDRDIPDKLPQKIRRFTAAAERWLAKNIGAPYRDDLLDVYFTANTFLRVAERYDERYATILTRDGKDLTVRLFCIDPSVQMREALARVCSTVFFSATMVPTNYFRNVLGLDMSAPGIILPSPFPPEHLHILCANRISTLYRDREKTKESVTHAIAALVTGRKGNYLVYFPSYEYMTSVHQVFHENYPAVETLVQSPGMTESERGLFLDRFRHDNDSTLVGFAVMGGIFGEGIDLTGDRLTGAAIIGVGLPGLSPERGIIRDYFNTLNGSGFEFAYMYPGINKVLQAAGRVIRSENDRGVILLVDRRFGSNRYRSLLPNEWDIETIFDDKGISDSLSSFWNTVGRIIR